MADVGEAQAPEQGRTAPEPAAEPPAHRRPPRSRLIAAAAAAVLLVLAVVVIAVAGSGGGSAPPNAAAGFVPADALAYVNLGLDRGRGEVNEALAIARRFPDFQLAGAGGLSRLATLIAGGSSVDYARQIRPWLGGEAALALLDTPTSTAGTLLLLSVTDAGRARSYVKQAGASAAGSYRGHALLRYANGNELAFAGRFLLIGQPASLREALDVAAHTSGSLAGDAVYRRATAGQPAERVADAYASVAGVRRLLADQSGALGAIGTLLYQPALEGVSLAVTPTGQGFALRVHSALDPSLAAVNQSPNPPFTPSLAAVMPTGASLLLDVSALDKVAPKVLNAGSAAGVSGGLGPLLSRLGAALKSEGVNVADLVSIFDHEAAVAIVPHKSSPTLVIAARTSHQAATARELAELEAPLAQLFAPAGNSSASAPVFNDRQIGSVTAHQLALSAGLQFDYAVFHGLVVISTGLSGIQAVVQRSQTLAADPGYRAVLGTRPSQVTSLVYANPAPLLNLGSATGLTDSSLLSQVTGDLKAITAAGLTSTRTSDATTSELTLQIK